MKEFAFSLQIWGLWKSRSANLEPIFSRIWKF